MSDFSNVFGHTRRPNQQTQQPPGSQRPSSMGEDPRMGMGMGEDEPAWEPGHPTQHEWGEPGWQSHQGQGAMPERSAQGAGYTMPGQTQPQTQTGGTQRYGGPTTRSQGMRTRRMGEEEEPEDISKVYSEESYGRSSAGSHEGDYFQGSQRARQGRSQGTGEEIGHQGSEQHGGGIMESIKGTAKKMTGMGHKGQGGSGSSGIS